MNENTPENYAREVLLPSMKLWLIKPAYKTNTRPVHWAVLTREQAEERGVVAADLRGDSTILAVWEDDQKFVFAFVDLLEFPLLTAEQDAQRDIADQWHEHGGLS